MNFIKLNSNLIFHESGTFFILEKDGEKELINIRGINQHYHFLEGKEATEVWAKLIMLSDVFDKPNVVLTWEQS